MTTEKLEKGAYLLIEIKALKDVVGICSAQGWKTAITYKDVKSNLSVLGTDYGKPNATELMTEVAQKNRKMFSEMSDIVNKRIEELEKQFEEL